MDIYLLQGLAYEAPNNNRFYVQLCKAMYYVFRGYRKLDFCMYLMMGPKIVNLVWKGKSCKNLPSLSPLSNHDIRRHTFLLKD